MALPRILDHVSLLEGWRQAQLLMASCVRYAAGTASVQVAALCRRKPGLPLIRNLLLYATSLINRFDDSLPGLMSKLSSLLALLAAAASLHACSSAPISADGRGQRSKEASNPAAAGSGGASAATAAAAWLQFDLGLLTTLSDENFTDALEHTEHALVIFFAPYSGHCKVRLPPLPVPPSLPAVPQLCALACMQRPDEQSARSSMQRARHALAAAAPDIRERHPGVLLAQVRHFSSRTQACAGPALAAEL